MIAFVDEGADGKVAQFGNWVGQAFQACIMSKKWLGGFSP